MTAENSIDQEIKWAEEVLREAQVLRNTFHEKQDEKWCKGYLEGLSFAKDHIIKEKIGQIILDHEAAEALEREARKRVLLPDNLVERIVRDWLTGKGNLRIY